MLEFVAGVTVTVVKPTGTVAAVAVVDVSEVTGTILVVTGLTVVGRTL